MMSDAGVPILDADKLGHAALAQTPIKQKIMSTWGNSVFDPSGEVNRAALGNIVFGNNAVAKSELAKLESITHPFINQSLAEQIERLRSTDTQVVLLDAPILIKAGWDQFCDEIIFVDANETLRYQRAASRGWSKDHFVARESAQAPLELKRQRSTVIVDNNGDEQQLQKQVSELLNRWLTH